MKFAGIRFGEFLSRLVIKRLALVGPLALLCLTAGCGGGGGTQTAIVAVTVSPTPATVLLGAMQAFMANVTGTNNTAVTWTVQEGAAGGSITGAGVYTAPQVAGTYHVIATSVADTTKNGTATIKVPVAVTVNPPAPTVFLGAMQTFVANVAGTTNMAVTWTVQEAPAGGSITSSGVYTAPQVAGTYHVIATSVADATQSATATITVPPFTVMVSPPAPTVFLGAMQTFVATVTATNMAVTWTVQEGAAGGSITSTGVYTAPQVAGTYHVIATSVADATQSATATITVPPITVIVSPPAPTVFLGAMQTFVATVTATNMAVTWTVQEGAAGGSITNAGVYTAPQVVGTYHVIATSVADPSKFGSATVTVPPVAVSIFPTSDTLGPSGMRIFVARVTGAINTAVTWSIAEGAAGGTVDVNGHYTAPTAQGAFHVVATSVADPTKSAPATVTVVPSGFLPTGSMTTPRFAHTATLLNTGKALVAGGITDYRSVRRGGCVAVVTNLVDLFDPAAGAFAATGSMTSSRYAHTATLLQDGRVLVAGGFDAIPLQSAEIFDPAAATFTATGNMLSVRQHHTATLLPDGKVLVTGGETNGMSAELFDPKTGSFTSTGSMTGPRFGHTATLLQTGKVLVAGGIGPSGPVSTAELYDPVAGTFSPTGSMGTARWNHTATLLPSGTVLIAGGHDQNNPLTSAEIYDPVTGMFTPTGSMHTVHSEHTATLSASGKVLVAGGGSFGVGNFVAELFDPGTGTFSLTGSMLLPRISHTATLLPNGEVVVTGSRISNRRCGGATASAELYH
jgi:Kelch motif protein/galactose oxidase-like protein